jgi:hypothetical protein
MKRTSSSYRARRAPISIRLTDAEREALTDLAGDLPLSTYVKRMLFQESSPPRRSARRIVAHDRELALVLAKLGKSGLADSLRAIAIMGINGVLYVDDDCLAYLRRACDEVHEMRALLLAALGKEPDPDSAKDAFQSASGRLQ